MDVLIGFGLGAIVGAGLAVFIIFAIIGDN